MQLLVYVVDDKEPLKEQDEHYLVTVIADLCCLFPHPHSADGRLAADDKSTVGFIVSTDGSIASLKQ